MFRRGRAAGAVVAGLAAAALLAWLGFGWWRTRNLGPVARGRAVARSHGCFGCHGPGGTGHPPGEIDGAPSFSPADLRAYASGPAEIRQWVHDGASERFRADLEALEDGERPLLRMPAFGGVLSERELEGIVAWLTVLGDFEPPPAGAPAEGRATAARFGCFTCHGPQGRADNPNPGSLKGYIPAWDGADFPELARDEEEIREWILDGSPRRLREHPIARWFISHQVIGMPAYRGRIPASDVDLIVAYVGWLRESGAAY